jgi:hypothetical protein
MFRIGLEDIDYTPTAQAPARYARVKVTVGGVNSYIYIRQGESADYLMRPDDFAGNNTTNWSDGITDSDASGVIDRRPYARKFVPFNLKDPNNGQQNQLTVRGGTFTDYPSQAGHLFQFAGGTGKERIAWATVGTVIGYDGSYPTTFWDSPINPLRNIHETCPFGYRRPTDGNTATAANGVITISEFRQSLFLNPIAGNLANNLDNSVWGYYADGFFDRRPIISNSVAPNKTNIALIGRLFVNTKAGSSASIFIPAAGVHTSTGLLSNSSIVTYITTSSGSGPTAHWAMRVSANQAQMEDGTGGRPSTSIVRCIQE